MAVFHDETDALEPLVVDPETGEVADTGEASGTDSQGPVPGQDDAGTGGQTLYRAIVESMDDVALVVDESRRLVYANPKAREYAGASLATLRGTPVTRLSDELIATETDRERFESALEAVLSGDTGEFPRVLNLEFDLPAGEVVAEYKLSPFPGGETGGGAVIVARDVTERRARERDLEQMRQLQSRVLRHNIRNDLNVVRGYAELFSEEFDGEYAEMAESVVSTTDKLVSVSEKTRVIERLIRRDQSPVSLDIVALLERLVGEYRRQFPGASFEVDLPDECQVETVGAVELAFENLIGNAVEHAGAEPRVSVSVSETADGAVVTVSDDGPGIPEQELAVRDQGRETPLEHGSGLGLWVVEWLTKVSAVSVTYDTSGNGTDARVRLPCHCS